MRRTVWTVIGLLALCSFSVIYNHTHRSPQVPVIMQPPIRPIIPIAHPEAAALCAHLELHPDIASAEYRNTAAGNIELTLRPGVSDAKALGIARRIRRYLTRKYANVDARVIRRVTLHHDARESAELNALDKVAGANDHQGAVVAMVARHIAGAADAGWHIVVNRGNGSPPAPNSGVAGEKYPFAVRYRGE